MKNFTIVWHEVPTCSLTEAKMAEVVSVSDPSPLEAFSTGLNILEFSVSEGWSGTGITSVNQNNSVKSYSR